MSALNSSPSARRRVRNAGLLLMFGGLGFMIWLTAGIVSALDDEDPELAAVERQIETLAENGGMRGWDPDGRSLGERFSDLIERQRAIQDRVWAEGDRERNRRLSRLPIGSLLVVLGAFLMLAALRATPGADRLSVRGPRAVGLHAWWRLESFEHAVPGERAVEQTRVRCTTCGALSDEDARFCQQCGRAI